jgi:NDP-sugar pyrophosphorylase family protein
VERPHIEGNTAMKALILCAGFGTRLKPLTDSTAKPLVKILGIPVLEYTLNLLEQNGVSEVFINRHYFPKQFENIKIPKSMKATFSFEEKILGTLGGVLSFEDRLSGDDFMVINGDILFSLDLDDLVTKHKRKKNIATMVVKERESKDTPVFVDVFSNVVGIGGDLGEVYKKYMFAGVQVLNPEFFNVVRRKEPPACIVKDFYVPYIASGGHINSFIMKKDDLWIETGDLSKYIEGNIKMLDLLSRYMLKFNYEEFISSYWHHKKLGQRVTEIVDNIWIGDNHYVDHEAMICSPVFIGSGVKIEKGSVVGPNVVIGDDVTIGNNSHIKDSIILDGSCVAKNTTVYRSVVSKEFCYEDK